MTADRITVDELLADACSKLRRLTPQEIKAEKARGLTLLLSVPFDGLTRAPYTPRNVLEWRLNPACAHGAPDLGSNQPRASP